MEIPMCSKCHKNPAAIFMSRLENNVSTQDGFCLKCASELGLKQVEDMMKQMGITTQDIEMMSSQLPDNIEDMQDLLRNVTGQEADDFESKQNYNQSIIDMFKSDPTLNADDNSHETNKKSKKEVKNAKKEEKKYKHLTEFCQNLTKKAENNQIDEVIGRDEEISRIVQILNRRQKNNPCLIGEPGVGKTAIAEALAVMIKNKQVPFKLLDKEIFALDITSLIAGTQFRGQFESRIKGLIKDVEAHGNVILVIDEVHNLVGAGDSEGSMNAGNILKPALSRGTIQVIGATTFKEYRKYIEKDGALERRFQSVIVSEPSIESATKMLIGTKKYYEDYHKVSISDAMIREAVVLSERYITDRFLPDKAIDLIDEACSEINLNNEKLVEEYKLTHELKALKKESFELSLIEDAEDMTEIYAKIAENKSKTLNVQLKLEEFSKIETPKLAVSDLAKVIEIWTKIPASKVEMEEIHKLLGLEDRLRHRIIGQDEAISAIAKGIRRGRAGISPKKKPASFIFVGPTGVGKTELTKALTEDLFDTPDSLIRLDMSEYMEKHSVSRLIGAPPGYVGYDEAGQLTEKIRRRPYSVILLDEIEKAHPDVLNSLLQVLDDGKLTDASGRSVNFENTVIIMTSNAGSTSTEGNLGFGKSITDGNKSKSEKALSSFLRPEFINRIDKIVSFNSLTEENFIQIAKKMLKELSSSLKEKGISLSVNENIYSILAEKSYSIKFGARNLRRTIENLIEDEIAVKIIDSYNNPFTEIILDVSNNEISVISK